MSSATVLCLRARAPLNGSHSVEVAGSNPAAAKQFCFFSLWSRAAFQSHFSTPMLNGIPAQYLPLADPRKAFLGSAEAVLETKYIVFRSQERRSALVHKATGLPHEANFSTGYSLRLTFTALPEKDG